jgi:hypothetical protein
MQKQNGSALVLAIIIMTLLAAVIIGFSRNTEIDLLIGRNVRLMKQAFLWGDSGLEITESLIGYSEQWRGAKDNSTSISEPYSVQYVSTDPLYSPGNNTGVDIYVNGTLASSVRVRYLGQYISDGNSIKFESSSEGVGFGAGAGAVVARVYSLNSTGFSDIQSRKRVAEVYTSPIY